MTIDFTCQKCDASFELDADDLIDGTEKLVCPNCDAKAPTAMVEDFTAALVEMRAQTAVMAKRFGVNLAIESEDVEAARKLAEEDDEEEETDEDDDDLDLDEDEDEDLDDVDEDEDDDR